MNNRGAKIEVIITIVVQHVLETNIKLTGNILSNRSKSKGFKCTCKLILNVF